jgi:hypothetical protein
MDSKSHSPKFPLPLLPPVWQNFDLQNFVRHAATLGVQANRVTPFDPMYVLSLASVSLNLQILKQLVRECFYNSHDL